MKHKFDRFKVIHILGLVIIAGVMVGMLLVFWCQRKKTAEVKLDDIKSSIEKEGCYAENELKLLDAYMEIRAENDSSYEKKSEIIQCLKNNECNALVLGMWEAEEFSEKFFETYYGLNAAIVDECVENPYGINEYFAAVEEADAIKDVFLRINPCNLCENYYLSQRYNDEADAYPYVMQEKVWRVMEQNPNVTFHIFLDIKPIEYWSDLSDEEFWTNATIWYDFVRYTSRYTNAVINTMAADTWLIENDNNFDETGKLLPDVADTVLRLEISDYSHVVDATNFYAKWNDLYFDINERRGADKLYPDLTSLEIVFVGDGAFARGRDTVTTIPEYVHYYSGASVYNISNTFAPACHMGDSSFDAFSISKALESETACSEWPTECICEFERFIGDARNDKRTIFILNFGMADYLSIFSLDNPNNRYDETTLCGSLRLSIETIKEKYKDAEIIVMAPCYIDQYSEGTKSPVSGGYSLLEIIDAEHKVAKEEDIYFINAYSKCVLDKSKPVSSGLLPTNDSRSRLAKTIMKYLNSVFIR